MPAMGVVSCICVRASHALVLCAAKMKGYPRPSSWLLLIAQFYLFHNIVAAAKYDGGTKPKPKEGTPLPMGSARPQNMDAGIDCDIKELAWEYAKKLLPQVSYACMLLY